MNVRGLRGSRHRRSMRAGLLAGLACLGGAGRANGKEDTMVEFTLTSPAFATGHPIPAEYTADGADRSPPLNWTSPPAGTAALVLICDDPDAPRGAWVHWVLYGIPPERDSLPAGVDPAARTIAELGTQGRNDFGRIGYGGPAPPPGKPHRYLFKLFAISEATGLQPGATKTEVLRAIQRHVLKDAVLMGTYQR